MEFLFGDSTPSPLTSNFLEFLRDAIDFGVLALHVDDEIAGIHDRERALSEAADEEIARLEALGAVVIAAIGEAPKGDVDSDSARCGAQLDAASAEIVRAAVAAVHDRLAGQRAALAGEEAAQREASFKGLESLLSAHSPPDSTVSVRVERGVDRGYTAWRHGESAFGLRWRVDLGVPAGHPLSSEAPMERLGSQAEIHAPEQTGWLKKEVKLKAQRLDRLQLTEAVDDGRTLALHLRTDVGGPQGVDLVIDPVHSTVSATRTAVAGDPSAGAFEVPAEDVPALVALAEKVRAAMADLTPTRLAEATLGDQEFRLEPAFGRFVQELVAFVAPIVQDVARHSLTSTEFVLRRLITRERREEIFVAKSTLRDKYAPLRPELREIFDRLGLDTIAPPPDPSVPAPEEQDWSTRAELPRSEPPPPLKAGQ